MPGDGADVGRHGEAELLRVRRWYWRRRGSGRLGERGGGREGGEEEEENEGGGGVLVAMETQSCAKEDNPRA